MRYPGGHQCNQFTMYENPGNPLVIFVHGGGWIGGTRYADNVDNGRSLAWLAQQGYEVASIDYRTVMPSGAGNFPEGRDDVCEAIAHLKDYTNADKVIVMGTSAGGNLGCLASQRRSDIVNGFIGLYCPFDLRKRKEFSNDLNHILNHKYYDRSRNPRSRHKDTSPAKTIKTQFIPQGIFIGGADDTTVLPIQWERFGAQVNVPTHTLPGLGHGFNFLEVPESRALILEFLEQFR